MDDPTVGPSAPVRLRRTCERNRLEKQFVSDAYECLVAMINHRCDERVASAVNERSVATEYRTAEIKDRPIAASAACGMAHC
jgi:hypothetical protein